MALTTTKLHDKFQVFCDDGKTIKVVVETPCGSRNKFQFVRKEGIFLLKSVFAGGGRVSL